MSLHVLTAEQILPISLEEAWDFMSSPHNLSTITPDDMQFEVLTDLKGRKMHAGMVIQYIVRPILSIPMNWVTEITHVEHLKFFVDEQRFGPYAFWHHQHHLEAVPEGVLMKDIIHYKLPLGFIGKLMNQIMVKRQLKHIFAYRRTKLIELFGPA